jgi:histidine decarboxylase
VPYLNGVIPTINCSRSGFDALKLYWRIVTTGEEGFRAETAHVLKMTQILKDRLTAIGVKTYVNPWSTTVCMERPAEEVVHKYAMACGEDVNFGKLAHVVVMQFFTEELIEEFVRDVEKYKRA